VALLIKGGQVDLWMEDGTSLVLPENYGIVHDTEGAQLDGCTLFLGPFTDRGEFEGEPPKDASEYFGNDHSLRRASIDVPEGEWQRIGRAREIVYYRPGKYEDDWRHEFREPVPVLQQGDWLALRLPADCEVTWRGIVRP
jgi:hypothetical protein